MDPRPGLRYAPAMAEIRQPAEVKHQAELAALALVDEAPKPPGWRLSPRAVETYILGSDAPVGGVALPAADWAENAGTITNAKGHVQRMHAAFAPLGSALPGWEAIVRLGAATGVKRSWTHPREVFTDMVAAVPTWSELKWAREARPLQLRFAGSRG